MRESRRTRPLQTVAGGLLLLLLVASVPAGRARASTVTLTGGTLGLEMGALPAVRLPANTGGAFALTAGGGFTEQPGTFGPITVPLARSLFMGVPQISGLTLAAFGKGTKVVDCSGAHCAGTGGLVGHAILNILQLENLSIPLSVVGQPSGSWQLVRGSIIMTVLGEGWTSGTATVPAVTSTTPGTAVIHTVTRMGSDSCTGTGAGQITLVSGFQGITNVMGTLPGFATQVLRFTAAPPWSPGATRWRARGRSGSTAPRSRDGS